MKSSILFEMLLILPILALAGSSHIPSASAATVYAPGVKVGDSWTFGRPQGFCLSPCPPGFSDFLNSSRILNQVTTVSGGYVVVNTAITYANGTTTSRDSVMNVDTGANVTRGSLVIAADLAQGDHLFNSSSAPTINSTTTRTYAGAARQVNVLNTTNGYPGNLYDQVSFWDQPTGILTEFRFTTPSESITFRLVQTNLWSGPPDFTISVFPEFVVIPYSPPNNTFIQLPTVTLSSVSNFTGLVDLIAQVGPQGLVVRFGISNNSTASLFLPPNGTNQTALVPDEFPRPAPGTYFVSVTGVSGSLVHSINVTIVILPSVCGPPQCGFEALNLENYSFTSTTSATLYLRNAGNSSIALVTYYVRDAQGDQYANTVWNGPTIFPNQVAPTVFPIGNSCSNCVLTGSAFTFTPGNAYTITVVSSRNNQFTFTIIGQVLSQLSDFNLYLSLNPTSNQIIAGGSSTIGVYLTSSQFGPFFNSTVTLTAQILPSVPNGPVPSFNPNQISLVPPAQSFSTLTTSTTASTPPGNYTIVITGTSGGLTHSVQAQLTVLEPPALSLNPSIGTLGTLVTVHGSSFLNPQSPFGFPLQIEITFDNQFVGFVFLTNSSFDFSFSVPHSDPTRLHHVHAIEPYTFRLDVQATFTYLQEPSPPAPLSVTVSTGPIYFPGETVLVSIQTSMNGQPVSASSLQLLLVRPNGSSLILTATPLSQDLWRASYTIPATGSIGTYTVVVRASTASSGGSSIATFEVKQTWLQGNGRTVGTIAAAVGLVGVLALSWRKGVLSRRKDDPSSPLA